MTCYQPFQKLYPLSLLAKSIERQYRGGLQVYDGSVTWLVYLESGGPIYATNSIEPFERLDRHLCNLTPQVPTSVMRGQIRWLFGSPQNTPSDRPSDYKAICWLVQNHYLNAEQAAKLVEAIAKEAIETLLSVREGAYQFIELQDIAQLPKFCQLNLKDLVKKSPHRPESKPNISLTDRPGTSFASPQLFLEPHRLSPPQPTSSAPPSVRHHPHSSRPPTPAEQIASSTPTPV
ncbi:two-component system response regulator, partial [Oscillatoriales cyanobacterium LEGE 11467]|nr:two-component system response regulator [Zarconia navalis LEGE 11467]